MYEYRCIIRRVVDGDTVDVDIDLGFNNWMINKRVRLVGIDAPGIRTKDLVEKEFGHAAMDFVIENLPEGSTHVLKTFKDDTGKYGRIIGDFLLDNTTLTEKLLAEHLAIPYGAEDAEELHRENQRILIESGKVVL